MSTELSPLLEAARQILAEAKQPMHVNDVATEAVRTHRNQQMSAEDFAKRLSSALSANLKTKSPVFAKVKNKDGSMKRGIYRLRQTRAPSPIPVEVPQVTSAFLGKAGEHAVMSELLFWGFNASLMAVDEGIDVVASKENRYFHIQVKTSSPSDTGRYTFTIRNESFESNDSAQTFYIFVMRRKGGGNDYAVIPSSHLRNLKGLGVIGSATGLSITIAPDDKGRVFTMNRRDDITLFINNFGLIR